MIQNPRNTAPRTEGIVYELNHHARFELFVDLDWLYTRPEYTLVHKQIFNEWLEEKVEIAAFFDPITRDVNFDFKLLDQVLDHPSYTYHLVVVTELVYDTLVFSMNTLKKVSAIWHVERDNSIRDFSIKKLCNLSDIGELMSEMKVKFSLTLSRCTRPFRKCTKHVELIQHMIRIFSDAKYCNITIEVADSSFKVHEAIIRRFKMLHEKQYDTTAHPCSDGTCSWVDHLSQDHTRKILYYLYTNELDDFSQLEVSELHDLSLKLNMNDMCLDCEKILQHRMVPENVAEILVFAYVCNNARLMSLTMKFIVDHEARVIVTPTFRQLLQSYPAVVIDVWKYINLHAMGFR